MSCSNQECELNACKPYFEHPPSQGEKMLAMTSSEMLLNPRWLENVTISTNRLETVFFVQSDCPVVPPDAIRCVELVFFRHRVIMTEEV